MKQLVAAQDENIHHLEQEIAALKKICMPTKAEQKPVYSGQLTSEGGWRKTSNWAKIKNGMSEKQVIAILGQPTSTEGTRDLFLTLFYRGEIPVSGFVSGNVKISDDRVWSVNEPVF